MFRVPASAFRVMKTRSLSRPDHLENPANGSVARRVRRLEKLPPASLILGVDPGLHRTGYGLIRVRNAEAGTSQRGTCNSERGKVMAQTFPRSEFRVPSLV